MSIVRMSEVPLLLIAALPLCSCGSQRQEAAASRSVTTGDTVSAPSVQELKEAVFHGLDEPAGPIALRDGEWVGSPYVGGGAARPRVSLVDDLRLASDVDADGRDDAIVFLAESAGGSGTRLYLAVVARRGEEVVNLATRLVGDRVQIRSIRVDSGMIVMSVVRAGTDDAACCPSELATYRWRLQSDTLLSDASPPLVQGRLSLELLAGTQWQLRSWDWNESAPAEPRITLAFQGDRVGGSSGCNSYSTSMAEGDQPGDVAVGPLAVTRMACPTPIMDLESRYLKELGAVRRYGFITGQLALTYEVGGTVRVMRFDQIAAPRAR